MQSRGRECDPAVDAAWSRILAQLAQIEQDYRITILYACESGSRAWGFASQDSDFDVRFIFTRPLMEYLRLRPAKDAFDLHAPGELDLGGWDIRKACELMRKSNAPLLEWLDSPIIYRADEVVSHELIQLRTVYFDARKAAYHYLSLAANVFSSYLDDERPKRKKYLYVLRPLAGIRFIQLHMAQPPTQLARVLEQIDWSGDDLSAVNQLIAQKKAGDELDRGPRDQTLDRLIRRGLSEAESAAQQMPVNDISTDQLDQLIHKAILDDRSS